MNKEADGDSRESCVPPSSNAPSKDLFCKDDIVTLTKCCAAIIACGPISDSRISDVLDQTPSGSRLLKKYTPFQLKNRIKYERRKCIFHKGHN